MIYTLATAVILVALIVLWITKGKDTMIETHSTLDKIESDIAAHKDMYNVYHDPEATDPTMTPMRWAEKMHQLNGQLAYLHYVNKLQNRNV